MKNLNISRVLSLLSVIVFVGIVDASHFRYGTVKWVPSSDAKSVTFSLELAFRYDFQYVKPVPNSKDQDWTPNVRPSNLYNCPNYIGSSTEPICTSPLAKSGDIIWPNSNARRTTVTSAKLGEGGTFCWQTAPGLAWNAKDTYKCAWIWGRVGQIDSTSVGNYLIAQWNYTTYFTDAGTYNFVYYDFNRLAQQFGLQNNAGQPWTLYGTFDLGKRKVQTKQGLVWNASPSSGVIPITQIYRKYINRFQIYASDDGEDDQLIFALAPASRLCNPPGDSSSSCTQLAGASMSNPSSPILTVDTTGYTCVPTSTTTCYYQTQITVTDPSPVSIPIDFLLVLTDLPITCHESCTNKGAVCTDDNTCVGCAPIANITGGRTCRPTGTLPYFVFPTPANNARVNFTALRTNNVTIKAQSDNKTLSVYLSTPITPSGTTTSVWGNPNGNNPSDKTLYWTPSINDVGSYAVTISVRDSNGLVMLGSAQGFFIDVIAPECGYGDLDKNTGNCVCPKYDGRNTGFDPTCTTCKDGFFGTSCKPCPNCNQGSCIDGLDGTGQCFCANGWVGAYCNISQQAYCDNGKGSAVISQVNSTNYVSVESVNAYVASNQQFTALQVPITLNVPAKVLLDVMFLVDTVYGYTTGTSGSKSNLASNTATLFTNLQSLSSSIYLGAAYYTTTADYVSKLDVSVAPNGDNVKDAFQNKFPTTASSNNAANSNRQLKALIAAINTATSWRPRAFKIITVLTGQGLSYTADDVTAVKAACISANIVPVFVVASTNTADLSTYNNFVTALGFGAAAKTTVAYPNYATDVPTAISSVLGKAITVKNSDPYKFVDTITPDTMNIALPSSSQIQVGLRYPSGATFAGTPIITINVMGYGTTTFILSVNHAPTNVFSPESITFDRYSSNNLITPRASDEDNNILSIYYATLPNAGVMTTSVSTSASVKTGVPYALSTAASPSLYWSPPTSKWTGTTSFTYNATDGCLWSPVFSLTITVPFTPGYPTCSSFSVNAYQNSKAIIQFIGGQDDDDSAAQLTYRVLSTPDNGVVSQVNGGSLSPNIAQNQQIAFTPNPNYFTAAGASPEAIVFSVTNRGGNSNQGDPCTLFVRVIHVNQQPVAYTNSISLARGASGDVQLSSTDIDNPSLPETATYYITSITSSSTTTSNAAVTLLWPGQSTPVDSSSITSQTQVSNAVSLTNGASSSVLTVTVPNTATKGQWVTINYRVQDSNSSYSSIVSITVSVKDPIAPSAISTSIRTPLGTNSAGFALDGTAGEPADVGALYTIVTVLPRKGTLYYAPTNTAVSTSISYLTSSSKDRGFYIVPGPVGSSNFGSDSITFTVNGRPNGGISSTGTVSVYILQVNRAPTSSAVAQSGIQGTLFNMTSAVSGSDLDVGQSLTAYITSFPANGILTQYGTTTRILPCPAGQPYTPSSPCAVPATLASFYVSYLPNPSFFTNYLRSGNRVPGTTPDTFSAFVQDDFVGSSDTAGPAPGQSSTVTVNINVTEADVAPVAVGDSKTVDRYDGVNSDVSSYTLTLSGTDANSEDTTFSAFIVSLPDTKLVSSVTTSDGRIVSAGSTITSLTLTFNLVKFAYGDAVLNFKVYTSTVVSANTAAATLTVNFRNIPPVCKFTPPVGPSGLIALPRDVNSVTEFDLSVVDPDTEQTFTFSIFGYTVKPTSGAQSSITLENNQVLSAGSTQTIGGKTSTGHVSAYFRGNGVAADGANSLWTSFNFTVSDGTDSSSCYVPISVTEKAPPVANPVAPIYTPECSKTQCQYNGTRTLSGTDEEPPKPIITSLPTHGFLYDVTSGNAITGTNVQRSTAFYYKPEPYYVGPDSYQYYVQDKFGSVSAKLTGQITVYDVAYPPIAQFNGPLVTPQDTPLNINVEATNILAYKNDGVTVDNTVTVFISGFATGNPVPGTLYQYVSGSSTDGIANAGPKIDLSSGTPVAITNTAFSFIYVPPFNTYGPALSNVTFYVVSTEGLSSNVITFPIDVTFVPQPPVAVDSSITFAQNTPTRTAAPLTITDPNNYRDGPVVLVATINSLPDAFLKLVRSDGSAVQIKDTFTAINGVVNDIFVITPNPGPYRFGTTSFTFSAQNNWLSSVRDGNVNIVVTPITLQPEAIALSPILAYRTVPVSFLLNGTDSQPSNVMSLVLSSITANSSAARFSGSDNNVISAAGTTLVSASQDGLLTTSVSFVAPAIATPRKNFASLTFYAEINNVKSIPFTVYVDLADNNPPTSVPLAVTCDEDSHTDAFSLNANDVDVADKTTLSFIITQLPLPTEGIVSLAATGAAVVATTEYPINTQLVFTPRPLIGSQQGYFGSTQMLWKSKDQLGALSLETYVNITVNHVNHRPTASAPAINTTQNSQGEFLVSHFDVDKNDSPLVSFVKILTADVSGQLLTEDGQQITAPFQGAFNSFLFVFNPNKDTYGYLGSVTLEFNDGQGASNSASAVVTVPIYYTQTPYPPVGADVSATTNQSTPIAISFPGLDIDSPLSSINVVSFPPGGTIKRPDGTVVDQSNPSVPCTVPNVPAADLTKANTIQNYTATCSAIYVPFAATTSGDVFTYTLSDSTGLKTPIYTANITVIANRPKPIIIPTPTFPVINNNTMIIDVLQNSLAIFSVRGASQDGELPTYPFSWRLYLTSTVARGDLEFYDTKDDGTFTVVPVVNVDAAGTLFYASSNLYQFKYQPPQDVFGDNFANFKFFVRDTNGDSILWTIIFNVIHVPQPPNLFSVKYQIIDTNGKPQSDEGDWDFVAKSPVVGIENYDVVISWNSTSVDVQTGVISWLSLDTVFVLAPQKGSFYAALKQTDGSFKMGSQIVKANGSKDKVLIPRDTSSDSLWRVIFRPLKNDHAYVYATFSIYSQDSVQPGTLTSPVRTANIRIKSVPEPPTAQWALDGAVNAHPMINITANSVIISGNVTAPDAGIKPIAMNVTIVRADGKPIGNENVTLVGAIIPGGKKNKCSYVTPSLITCMDNTIKLNGYLGQVILTSLQTDVVYNVVLSVNSLGAGADRGETALYSVQVQDIAIVRVIPPVIVPPTKVSNNNALAGIIAGASVAGAFAAFGAFRLIRKSNPPITGFFGEEAFAGNAITDNPLYVQSGGNFDNPLYASSTS